MPKRNDQAEETEIVKVRLGAELRASCTSARLAGGHQGDAESTFLGYLVWLGLKKYTTVILPAENSEDENKGKQHYSASTGPGFGRGNESQAL